MAYVLTVLLVVAAYSVYASFRLFWAEAKNDTLTNQVNRLLDDVTKLAAQIPKHDAKGRFAKK